MSDAHTDKCLSPGVDNDEMMEAVHVKSDKLLDSMQSLRRTFNPAAATGLCGIALPVGWDGHLHVCDFNQMLGLGVDSGAPAHIRDFVFMKLRHRQTAIREPCLACTAGAGFPCQGALEE